MDKRCGTCFYDDFSGREEPCRTCVDRDDYSLWEPKSTAGVPPLQSGLPVPGQALPTDPAARKNIPVYSGFIAYFPRAICAVAELSRIGNEQHNPGKPLHWDRSKSGDEKDALMRHLLDQTIDGDNAADTDGVLHATKKAWRAMADLEKILEARAND